MFDYNVVLIGFMGGRKKHHCRTLKNRLGDGAH